MRQGLSTKAALLVCGALWVQACAVTVAEREFFRPQDAELFRMGWTYANEGQPRLKGEAARNAIFAKLGIEVTDALLETPTGIVELRHVRQSDPARPLVVYCGGTSFELEQHSDTVAFLHQRFGDMLFWNYPGYGESEGAPTQASVAEAGAAVVAALDSYRRPGQDVVFWGHSLGGFVCTDLASRYPDVSALVLETTARTTPDAAKAFGALATRGLVRVKLDKASKPLDIVDILGGATHPVIVLGAGQDRVLPVELSRDLAAGLEASGRNVSYLEFAKANHFLVGVQPDFAERMSTALGQTVKDAPELHVTETRAR